MDIITTLISNLDKFVLTLVAIVAIATMGPPYVQARWGKAKSDDSQTTQLPAQGQGAQRNTNDSAPISKDGAKLLIAEHVQNCPRMARMESKLDVLITAVQDMRVLIEKESK